MSIVILQDEIVHYEVLGRGRPLIFLHGWVGSWRYWIPSMQSASISYRTYALDLWGFGDTAKKADHYTLEQQVNLLDQFLQEMGIARIALIGHGLGAVVATLFALKYQRKIVDRLMAVSLPNGTTAFNSRLYSAPPIELADWLLSRTSEAETTRMETHKADQQAIQLALTNLQSMNMIALAQQLSTPCLLVYGQNDPTAEMNSSDASRGHPEHMHQINFEQSGHFPMLDEPSKFNRLMADFLSLSSGASPSQLQLKEEWKRRVR
jgi:pimeloyl-ACP methyl ester carboxylesterase